MNSQSYQSLKYQRLTPIFCKVIEIRKFKCVAKTQIPFPFFITLHTMFIEKIIENEGTRFPGDL